MSTVRHFVPKQVLINTYNAYIQPHIDYGLPVWGYTHKTNLIPIERQQRKAVRIMNFLDKRADPYPYFKCSNILSLDQSLKLSSSKLLWKADNQFLPPTVNSIFNSRNNKSFHVPYRRIDLTQHCISYHGTQVWNRIPLEIRSAKTINSFKINYKKYLLNQ